VSQGCTLYNKTFQLALAYLHYAVMYQTCVLLLSYSYLRLVFVVLFLVEYITCAYSLFPRSSPNCFKVVAILCMRMSV
jgi:hypothetical protein